VSAVDDDGSRHRIELINYVDLTDMFDFLACRLAGTDNKSILVSSIFLFHKRYISKWT